MAMRSSRNSSSPMCVSTRRHTPVLGTQSPLATAILRPGRDCGSSPATDAASKEIKLCIDSESTSA
uniref:Uncharacterized protein n=1 Tax=Arundo donax TaxID=35708 RepID=A0A0A9AY48_ARUDO